jgi:hypothetical protein
LLLLVQLLVQLLAKVLVQVPKNPHGFFTKL